MLFVSFIAEIPSLDDTFRRYEVKKLRGWAGHSWTRADIQHEVPGHELGESIPGETVLPGTPSEPSALPLPC